MTSNYVLHYAFQFVCQITVLKSKLTCNTFLVLTSFFSLRFQDGEHRCFTDCELSQRQKKKKSEFVNTFHLTAFIIQSRCSKPLEAPPGNGNEAGW